MDLKIGIVESAQVLDIELADDVDRAALRAELDAALAGDGSGTIWIADKRGSEMGVAAARIAFVQLGNEDDARRIGFGA